MPERELQFSQEMEPFDYLMFRGEGDPRSRASMLSVSLLDRSPGLGDLRSAFDRASRVVLRLRQRVVVPSLPVTAPHWVVDPDFDLSYHVRCLRVPVPGGRREVLDLATSMMMAPLDTARPLWEAVLVEDVEVEGAHAALILKVHHSVTDGAGAVELLLNLFDFERDPARGPMPPLPVPGQRSPTGLVGSALRRASLHGMSNARHQVGGLVGRAVGVARDPRGKMDSTRRMAASMRRVARRPPALPSPLLSRRGLGRGLETLDVPLDRLRAAAKSADCSVNDAYVAALCGALRRYHEALGVPVDALPFAMPVNVRTDDDPAGGNRFAAARLAAPVGELDPVERMRRIRAIVRASVDEPAINAAKAVAPVLSRMPKSLLGALASSAAGTDVQVSNVVGYPDPPYVAGAEIKKSYWFGPLPGVAMMVVLMSQAGTCSIGVHYDTASVTDPELFAQCLRDGFDEVLAVAPTSQRA